MAVFGVDFQTGAEGFRAALHVGKTPPLSLAKIRAEAVAVVFDLHLERSPHDAERDLEGCRFRMPRRVRDGLLEQEKKMPPRLGRKLDSRRVLRQDQLPRDSLSFQNVRGEVAEPVAEALQVVAARIDGPDAVAQGIDYSPRRLANLLQETCRFAPFLDVAAADFGQNRDAREAR